ncbi:methyltransferase small [Alicyclobacillus hesperidum URH17-3-68]|nr:methyltransferase small [Alicyclobacillus hesperidum URH17-3-68]
MARLNAKLDTMLSAHLINRWKRTQAHRNDGIISPYPYVAQRDAAPL